METTILGLGLGFYWANGKKNGNYYSTLGSYWDDGKDNGSYYLGVETTG